MSIRVVFLVMTLLRSLPAFSQEPAPQANQDPAAREESAKRLADIGKVQDDVKRRELLEKYIREYPKASNIDAAYSRLLHTLYKIDTAGTINLADEILALWLSAERPAPGEVPLVLSVVKRAKAAALPPHSISDIDKTNLECGDLSDLSSL